MRAELSRRSVISGAAATGALLGFPRIANAAEPLRITILGQALIRYDLRRQPWPAFDAFAQMFAQSHMCFSDLEIAIRGPLSGAPTRDGITLHTADPEVLDCLKALGISFLATSNNHAYDLGTGGILEAIDQLRSRGLAYAGSGVNIGAASGAGYQRTKQGTVAVVSVATGAVRDGGAAAPDRAGVAEIRRDASGALERQDVARTLAAIRQARTKADVVIAYQHNHYWEPNPEDTPGWQREFARECIDAGAGIFVGHGPPLLHGVEMYRGSPLLYGLGSFIFQTKKPEASYGVPNWQSLVVECRFIGGKFVEARLKPVQLASVGVGGADDLETRGRPSLAQGPDARRILDDMHRLSRRLGHHLSHDGQTALLRDIAA